MPTKRKSKIVYIDTNVVLDFVDKDTYSVVLMRSIKTRGWQLRISTLGMIEMCDYKKNDLYLWDKLSSGSSLNKIMKKLRNPREDRKLLDFHFQQTDKWRKDIQSQLPNLAFLDLQQSDAWELASDMSCFSNLQAKDAIHFATAVAAAQNGGCDFFVSNDGNLLKEAVRLKQSIKGIGKLRILTPKEFVDKYPPFKTK